MTARPFLYLLTAGTAPPVSIAAFAVLIGVGAWMVWLDPGSARGILFMLLLVQMFAAATGFLPQARRGHYDQMLVEHSRARVAVLHWLASIAPGVVAWILAGGLELVAAGRWPAAWSPSAVVAVSLVSCVAWAITVPAPRGTAGVVWVMALALLLTTQTGFEMLADTRTLVSPASEALVRAVVVTIICPFVLIAERPLPGSVVVACGVVAAVAWLVGFALVTMSDYPLEV